MPTPHSVHHPVFARIYATVAASEERKGGTEHRRELLAGLSGRVIEVGAGNGLNFRHYPPTVDEVVAVEPEPYLRGRAQKTAAETGLSITILEGVAEDLPVGDAAFDAGVASLVLCSVTDPSAALAELRRVIRPGGELRFYEHVRSNRPGLARAQRLLDATVWPWFTGGCHTSRDTLATIEAAGFTVEQHRAFDFGSVRADPAAPHVIGMARRR